MKLYWPLRTTPPGVVPYISQKFGEHGLDYSQFGLKGHNGLDMPAPRNTPILAVHDGWIIEQIAVDSGYGKRLCQRIEADGKIYVAIYGHQDHFDENVDIPWDFNNKSRFVHRGDVIGYVDSTGFSTGDHLHFGLYEYDEHGNKLNGNNGYGGCIDPMSFFLTKEDMSKEIIMKIEGTEEYVVGYRMTAPEALDSLVTLPMKSGLPADAPLSERIDWDAIPLFGTIVRR